MTVFAPMKHKYLESPKRNLEKYRTILSKYDLFGEGEGYIEIYLAIGLFLNDRVQQLS